MLTSSGWSSKDGSSAERLVDEVRLFTRRLKDGMGARPRNSRAPPPRPREPGRQEDPDRRRRHADGLRALRHLAGEGGRGPGGRQRPGGPASARRTSRRRGRADGHHDAGDGRLRSDAANPPGPAVSITSDHRAHRQSHEGRPGEVPGGRAPPSTSPSRSTATGCWRCCTGSWRAGRMSLEPMVGRRVDEAADAGAIPRLDPRTLRLRFARIRACLAEASDPRGARKIRVVDGDRAGSEQPGRPGLLRAGPREPHRAGERDVPRSLRSIGLCATRVVPLLRASARLNIWHGGCATGEEAYSTAILLSEAGLYDRCQIYATDLSPLALEIAKLGVYSAAALPDGHGELSGGGGNVRALALRHAGLRPHFDSRIAAAKHSLLPARSGRRPCVRRDGSDPLPQRHDLLRSRAAGARRRKARRQPAAGRISLPGTQRAAVARRPGRDSRSSQRAERIYRQGSRQA